MDLNFQALVSIFDSGEIQRNFRSVNWLNQIYRPVAGDLAELNLGQTVKQIHEKLKNLKQEPEKPKQL